MISKTITFKDYNGKEKTETYYFHMHKTELIAKQMQTRGGVEAHIKKIIEEQDNAELWKYFSWLVDGSYGVRSLDGMKFDKSPEHLKELKQTPAYDEIVLSLFEENEAAKFINGIIPQGN